MIHAARALGLQVMLGCMIESEPGHRAGGAARAAGRLVDLDGHLLISQRRRSPGSASRRRRRAARPRPGLGVEPLEPWPDARLAILTEGGFADTTRRPPRRAPLRHERGGGGDRLDPRRQPRRDHVPGLRPAVPIVATRRRGAELRRRHAADRRSRPPAASSPTPGAQHPARRSSRASTSRAGLHDVPRRRPRARPPRPQRHGVELRDLRRGARPASTCRRREPAVDAPHVLTVGSDCAMGKMTVCLELDAEAQRRGLRQRRSSPPARPGSRSRAGGSPSTRWSPTSSPAPPSGWCTRARAGRRRRAALDRGPGLDQPPGLLRRHARPAARLRAARAWCSCHEPGRTHIDAATARRSRRCPQLIDDYERMARLRAPGAGGRPSRSRPTAWARRRRARRSPRAEAETGLPADDPVRFGAARCSTRCLPRVERSSIRVVADPDSTYSPPMLCGYSLDVAAGRAGAGPGPPLPRRVHRAGGRDHPPRRATR